MNYLVLLNLAAKEKATAQKIMANLATVAIGQPRPIWMDSAYIGIAIETDARAADIWLAVTQGINENLAIKDLLIVETGRDWCCRNESAAHGWLNSHLGAPLPRTPKFGPA